MRWEGKRQAFYLMHGALPESVRTLVLGGALRRRWQEVMPGALPRGLRFLRVDEAWEPALARMRIPTACDVQVSDVFVRRGGSGGGTRAVGFARG